MCERCATRYPLVLVHGTGFREGRRADYWGRVPAALEAEGARVFYSRHDAWGKIEDCAVMLREAVWKALRETGANQVNVIAHSKGGLDARYMICRLGMARHVASLTTISTPHRGSRSIEGLLKLPGFVFRAISHPVNGWFRILGDTQPDFYGAIRQFTASACERFNRENPDVPGVYYQSYAAMTRRAGREPLLWLPHWVIRRVEGANDGLVPVESAKWGTFQGVLAGTGPRGVSHPDVVDARRRDPAGVDLRKWYVALVEGLRQKGF